MARKIMVALRGFSANGKDAEEGEDVTGKFDRETMLILKGMGRVAEQDAPDDDEDDAPDDDEDDKRFAKGTKGVNRAVAGTDSDVKAPALPALPGLPSAGA